MNLKKFIIAWLLIIFGVFIYILFYLIWSIKLLLFIFFISHIILLCLQGFISFFNFPLCNYSFKWFPSFACDCRGILKIGILPEINECIGVRKNCYVFDWQGGKNEVSCSEFQYNKN